MVVAQDVQVEISRDNVERALTKRSCNYTAFPITVVEGIQRRTIYVVCDFSYVGNGRLELSFYTHHGAEMMIQFYDVLPNISDHWQAVSDARYPVEWRRSVSLADLLERYWVFVLNLLRRKASLCCNPAASEPAAEPAVLAVSDPAPVMPVPPAALPAPKAAAPAAVVTADDPLPSDIDTTVKFLPRNIVTSLASNSFNRLAAQALGIGRVGMGEQMRRKIEGYIASLQAGEIAVMVDHQPVYGTLQVFVTTARKVRLVLNFGDGKTAQKDYTVDWSDSDRRISFGNVPERLHGALNKEVAHSYRHIQKYLNLPFKENLTMAEADAMVLVWLKRHRIDNITQADLDRWRMIARENGLQGQDIYFPISFDSDGYAQRLWYVKDDQGSSIYDADGVPLAAMAHYSRGKNRVHISLWALLREEGRVYESLAGISRYEAAWFKGEEPPFTADNTKALLKKVASDDYQHLRDLVYRAKPGLPGVEIRELCAKWRRCWFLTKDESARPQVLDAALEADGIVDSRRSSIAKALLGGYVFERKVRLRYGGIAAVSSWARRWRRAIKKDYPARHFLLIPPGAKKALPV